MITNEGFKTAVDNRRAALGYTQEELAERLGMKRTLMLGRMQKVGSTGSLELVYRMAEALDMTVHALLLDAERKPKRKRKRK